MIPDVPELVIDPPRSHDLKGVGPHRMEKKDPYGDRSKPYIILCHTWSHTVDYHVSYLEGSFASINPSYFGVFQGTRGSRLWFHSGHSASGWTWWADADGICGDPILPGARGGSHSFQVHLCTKLSGFLQSPKNRWLVAWKRDYIYI